MKEFKKLFKKTQTGAIQEWNIEVDGAKITTIFGQVGGKLQTTVDTIKEGKNIGRSNETSIQEQALAEAESKWLHQKKKGYVEHLDDAQNGTVDAVIEGGIPPMLSINKSYPKDPILEKYLKYPCAFQRKYDGSRGIAIVENGKATLWSRTRKPINCVPHIIKELERLFPTGKIILDFENYNHDYHDRFQDLMSIIRKNEPEGPYTDIQMFVYDCLECSWDNITMASSYKQRFNSYTRNLKDKSTIVIATPAWICKDFKELIRYYEQALADGYEGGMAKNLDAPYESGKRSKEILKMKEFEDGEGVVIGMETGRGKESDAAATFIVRGKLNKDKKFVPCGEEDPAAVVFYPRLRCSLEEKRAYLKNKQEYIGKIFTFTYKRLTDAGIPYIPIGVGIRSDYDPASYNS